MSLADGDILNTWRAFRERYVDRNSRYERIDSAVKGDWSVLDPDNEKIESRSPNLIQVALEDTADAASQLPTTRIVPRRHNPASKKTAQKMEYVAAGYFDYSQMETLVPQSVMDLAAFGLCPWVILPDPDEKMPIIEKRDPRTCYPEPGLRPGQQAKRVMFARRLQWTQLPEDYQEAIEVYMTDEMGEWVEERFKVTLIEWFDEDEYMIAAVLEMNSPSRYSMAGNTPPTEFPVVLDRVPNKTGACQVVINRRWALDDEFRGQFDQVIGVQEAHIRLQGLILDYSDQAVYSDVWVKDLIGDMAWGGGAYIELGPQGAIGRVPPAVSSLNVQQDLERLVDSMHVGGRWPKSRPGEIDQAIASAKFVEATAGMMNTTIKAFHQILKRGMEHALRLCFVTDAKYFPFEKTVEGILKNQEFVEAYNPAKDIDPDHRIRVEYGLGLGRDPAQSAVLMIQYAKEGYISQEFVQENIEGLTDIEREQLRIDTEKFEQMAMANLLQGLQSGQIPTSALMDIWEAREKGAPIREIYRKYMGQPAAPQGMPGPPGPMPTPGLPGPAGPGAPACPGGPAPGPPQPPVPPPPQASQLINRLATPIGNSKTLMGMNVRG